MTFTFGPTPGIPWLTLTLIAVIAYLANRWGYWRGRCQATEQHREP